MGDDEVRWWIGYQSHSITRGHNFLLVVSKDEIVWKGQHDLELFVDVDHYP